MKHKRKILTLAAFLVVFGYLLVSIIGLVRDIREKKEEATQLDGSIQELETEYEKLLEEQELLIKRDPEYMEKLARDLGLVKEGEIIFQERDE